MRKPGKTGILGKVVSSAALLILILFLAETFLLGPAPKPELVDTRNLVALFTSATIAVFALLLVKPSLVQKLFTLAKSDVNLGVESHATLVAVGIFIAWFLGVNLVASASIPLENLGKTLVSPARLHATLAAQTLLYLLLVTYVFLWVRLVNNKHSLGEIMANLQATKEKFWEKLGLGLALVPLLLLILSVYAKTLLELGVTPQPPEIERFFRGFPLLAGFYLSIVAGFGEEVFYRGFLQRRLGLWVATTLFALSHTYYQSIPSLVAVFILGLVIGLAYKWSKSLVTAISLHTAHNIGQFLILHLQGLSGGFS